MQIPLSQAADTSAQGIALVVLTCILAGLLALIGFAGRRWFTRQDARDELLARLNTQMELLNQGASLGAQQLFRTIAGRVDLLESAFEQSDDRLNAHDTKFAVIESKIEGHITTPNTYAHPPQMAH